MSRLIFVNRFYWPEEPATAQLLTDLAEAMAARGRAVIVITSAPGGRTFPEIESRAGVVVHRVGGSKLGNRSLLAHAWDFVTFAALALWRLARLARPGDTVIVMTDPPLLGIPAGVIARRRGARVIHWIQDIYPEAAVLLTGRSGFRWLRPLRDREWRAAHACVALGEDMADAPRRARVRPERLFLISNWAPAGITMVSPGDSDPLRAEWGLTGKFVVAYFGNLGRVHDLDPVIDLADRLRAEPEFQFVLIGPGAQRPRLEAAAQKRGLPNLRFVGAQPRERRTEILSLGDVHLVTLREGGERVVYPSKIYGICAAGRPVFFIGPRQSEIAQLVETHSLGLTFPRDDIAGMVGALREFRRDPARAAACSAAVRDYYEREASIEQAAAKWSRLLDGSDQSDTPRIRTSDKFPA